MSKAKTKELAKKIVKASDAYYNGDPIVSDKVWDAWFDELKKLDPDHPVVTGVGAIPVSEWKKVAHEVPMGSLNKVNTPEELQEWVDTDCKGEKEYLGTEKLDGISLSMKYEDGVFQQGLTRGDGETGEDISVNVKRMKGVPEKLKDSFSGHIRGEIVLLKSDHKKHFPEQANPRNAASGIAKRLDGDGVDHLSVKCYNVEGEDFKTELKAFERLDALGVDTPNYKKVTAKGAIKMWHDYQAKTRDSLDYEIDGLVFTVNDSAKKFSLGDKGRGPAGSMAFKFEAPTAETVIRKIIWQVGNTGRITPVAVFDEVDLLGAKVTRASLYNQAYIDEIGVGVGATVIVKRANDVIPRVEEVVKPGPHGVAKSPGICPECGTPTERHGEYLLCPNKVDCPPQVLGRISTWIAELGILEWGDKIIQKLIDAGMVEDVADIYNLTVDDIASLDRMGKRSAQNLVNELDKYRSVPLHNFIGGLGIENVATSTVKLVMGAGYDSLDAVKSASVSELEGISGFGNIKATALHNGVKNNADRIQDIINAGVKVKDKVKGVLSGQSFCFTGKSELPRKNLQKLVEENGGEVKKSVGKGLSFLVLADPNSTSAKAKAAKKNGTELLSEEGFMEMVNG